MFQAGDYVLIVEGQDDVADGQACIVLAPDETSRFHRYDLEAMVPVLCWTGYLVWTKQDNLIEINGDHPSLEKLFSLGYSRKGVMELVF